MPFREAWLVLERASRGLSIAPQVDQSPFPRTCSTWLFLSTTSVSPTGRQGSRYGLSGLRPVFWPNNLLQWQEQNTSLLYSIYSKKRLVEGTWLKNVLHGYLVVLLYDLPRNEDGVLPCSWVTWTFNLSKFNLEKKTKRKKREIWQWSILFNLLVNVYFPV